MNIQQHAQLRVNQLTQFEFDALPNNMPLNVHSDGAPPFNRTMLLWFDGVWEYVSYSARGWEVKCTMPTMYLKIDKYVIYHKLPDKIKEGSL